MAAGQIRARHPAERRSLWTSRAPAHARPLRCHVQRTGVGARGELGFEVDTCVATKPGFCHALVELNNPLLPAVQAREFERAKAVMAEAVRHARQATTEPVIPL